MRQAKLVSGLAAVALAVSALPAATATAAMAPAATAIAATAIAATATAGAAESGAKKTTTTTSRPAAFTPAASGQIAYISGNTLEVRNPETGQTTVDITQKTRITATVAVSLRAISVGACITVTGSKGKNGALDAATVTVAPTAGKCLAGGLRARVYGSDGHNSPPAFSGGTPRRRFSVPANFASAFGKVTSVSGSAIVIEGTMLSFASPRPGGTHPAAAPKPKKISVAVNAKTRYLRTGPGSAGSLKVGECATAFGSTNDIGAVSATRLDVSPATVAGCFGGFGGRGVVSGGLASGGSFSRASGTGGSAA